MAMDPHGYLRLGRALDFLVIEVRAAGVDSSKLEWARRFAGGSPSEYLGESLIAIDALLRERSRLADVVAQFAEGTAAEIRQGFDSDGRKPGRGGLDSGGPIPLAARDRVRYPAMLLPCRLTFSHEEMPLYRLCDEALFYVWDPIGANGAPEARGEYSAYLPKVYELVRLDKRNELIAYLTSVFRDRMGLEADESYSAEAVDFVMRARAWRERSPYR